MLAVCRAPRCSTTTAIEASLSETLTASNRIRDRPRRTTPASKTRPRSSVEKGVTFGAAGVIRSKVGLRLPQGNARGPGADRAAGSAKSRRTPVRYSARSLPRLPNLLGRDLTLTPAELTDDIIRHRRQFVVRIGTGEAVHEHQPFRDIDLSTVREPSMIPVRPIGV